MTTTNAPGRRSGTLRAALDDLRRMDAADPHVRLALGEGEFRLAIAPDTPVDEAIMLLRSAVAHDPFLAKGYLHLGRLLHHRGRYRTAATEYLAGLDLTPTSRRMHLLLAEALLEMGKDEQQAGQSLIQALSERDPKRVAAAVSVANDLLRGDGATDEATAEDGKKDATARKPPRRRSSSAGPPVGDVWLVGLSAELGRGAKPAQVNTVLQAGAADIDHIGPSEFVVGCLLALLTGHPPDQVRKAAASADPGTHRASDLVNRALTPVLELAETRGPVEFLRAAWTILTDGFLPAIVVHVLHHQRFGRGREPLVDGLRMVDAYPGASARDDGLQELRIALLDYHAAEAWDAGELEQARLLWRETLVIDPYRVPAASNLALLAAKAGAKEDYESAWERLFELLYLEAAGVGDVQLMLAERRDLHLALVRQSWQRHCASTSTGDIPGPAELEAWAADADALAIWLRDWDGYYVNARLSFRSPLHLLGVPRDVSPEGLTDARVSFERHIDAVAERRGWAGYAVFRQVAGAEVEDAYVRTIEPIERTRDPYYEFEKERADALAGEIVHRMLVLRSLIQAMGRLPATTERADQVASIVRHLALLPQATLRELLVERGLVERDTDPAELTEDVVVGLAGRWARTKDASDSYHTTVARCLDTIVEVMPSSYILQAVHAQALHAARRPSEAYATAMDVLSRPSGEENEQIADVRMALLDVVDRIGADEVPSELDRSPSVDQAKVITRSLETSLERYPASISLRRTLVHLYLELDRVESNAVRQRRAAELLVNGIVEALDERRSEQLAQTLTRIAQASVVAAVRAAAADLIARTPGRATDPIVVARITRCRALARERDLDDEVAALDRALARQPRRHGKHSREE